MDIDKMERNSMRMSKDVMDYYESKSSDGSEKKSPLEERPRQTLGATIVRSIFGGSNKSMKAAIQDSFESPIKRAIGNTICDITVGICDAICTNVQHSLGGRPYNSRREGGLNRPLTNYSDSSKKGGPSSSSTSSDGGMVTHAKQRPIRKYFESYAEAQDILNKLIDYAEDASDGFCRAPRFWDEVDEPYDETQWNYGWTEKALESAEITKDMKGVWILMLPPAKYAGHNNSDIDKMYN